MDEKVETETLIRRAREIATGPVWWHEYQEIEAQRLLAQLADRLEAALKKENLS